MIVDDDKEILELVSMILETRDYETLMVNNGRNLKEKINEFKPKTILLDIQLAEMDGRLLCKEIKEMENTLMYRLFYFPQTGTMQKCKRLFCAMILWTSLLSLKH